jgi:hypothetical protein
VTHPVDRIHHLVWCVYPENLARVRAYWEHALGIAMVDIDLPESGTRVLLAWNAGIEIVAPTSAQGKGAEKIRAILADRGEGVYSVVYSVASIEASMARLIREGATLERQSVIPPEVVRQRGIVAEGQPSFTIRQAQFTDEFGLGICLQELVDEPTGEAARSRAEPG